MRSLADLFLVFFPLCFFFNDTATTEIYPVSLHFLFFFNDTATTEIYTLSLHDALPILPRVLPGGLARSLRDLARAARSLPRDDPRAAPRQAAPGRPPLPLLDRERLLEHGGESGESGRDVAVHGEHGAPVRPHGRSLGGRAPRPVPGDGSCRQLPGGLAGAPG